MKKFNEFLAIFNSINIHLNERHNLGDATTFGEAIRRTRRENSIIRVYYEELKLFNEFRNVMIHKTTTDIIIAEPSDHSIERLKQIYNQLLAPKTIGSYLKKAKVTSFNTEHTIEDVLKVVKEHDYTFFPIFKNDSFFGILSSDGIVKAVSRYVENDIIEFSDIKIANFIDLDENMKNYSTVRPIDNLFDIVKIFEESANEKSLPITLLVSDGMVNNPDDIRGIITYWDLEVIKKEILS